MEFLVAASQLERASGLCRGQLLPDSARSNRHSNYSLLGKLSLLEVRV